MSDVSVPTHLLPKMSTRYDKPQRRSSNVQQQQRTQQKVHSPVTIEPFDQDKEIGSFVPTQTLKSSFAMRRTLRDPANQNRRAIQSQEDDHRVKKNEILLKEHRR